MEDKTKCKIAKDLMLSYVDNLLHSKSKEFVEEHLKECCSCKEYLETIKAGVLDEKLKNEKEDVIEMNHLKKVNRKITIFKIILLIILIPVIIYIGIVGYRYSIYSKMYDSDIDKHLGNNYRITTLINEEVFDITYYKDGVLVKKFDDGKIIWDNGNEAYLIKHDEKKYVLIESNGASFTDLITDEESGVGTGYGFGSTFKSVGRIEKRADRLSAVLGGMNIKSGILDNKEYYIIKINPRGTMGSTTLWIDKENFFLRKMETMTSYYPEINGYTLEPHVIEFIVEKNVITENDIVKPNFKDYILTDDIFAF